MTFRDGDIVPNRQIPWGQVRVGNSSDARWRGIPDTVEHIDGLEARRVVMEHDRS